MWSVFFIQTIMPHTYGTNSQLQVEIREVRDPQGVRRSDARFGRGLTLPGILLEFAA
jgi:hypothetical protein